MNDNTTLTEIIKENKGLIYNIIKKYTTYYEFDDLYQASIIGIIKAWNNYKKEKNVKFTTYAYKYILSEVLALIYNTKTIKTSKEYNKLYKKILEARTILTQKLMKEPTIKELSMFLEIDETIITKVLTSKEKVKSLDEMLIDNENNLTLLDKISSNNSINIDNFLLKEELKNLTAEEQELIKLRYFEEKTQQEVASYYKTNQVKISRNEQKILKKLKTNIYQT